MSVRVRRGGEGRVREKGGCRRRVGKKLKE